MKLVIILLFSFLSITAVRSQPLKSRAALQKEVIFSQIVKPQLDKGPLLLKNEKEVADFFKLIEDTWAKHSADSLKKYPSSMNLDEYKRLDAYTYVWALSSIKQEIDAGSKHADQLVTSYMVPAMNRDLAILEKLRNKEAMDLMHIGTIGNTLALGTMASVNKETFLLTAELFNNTNRVFFSLLTSSDSSIRIASEQQLKKLEVNINPVLAGTAFYSGKADTAMQYIMTGLVEGRYSPSRAIGLTKKIIPFFMQKGQQSNCLRLLQSLAQHITEDNLNRDTLLALYLQVDPQKGYLLYNDVISRQSGSSFIVSTKKINLPADWTFLLNGITDEQIKKAKYILIDFWHSACGPCIGEIPELNQFNESIKSRNDILFISVNTDHFNTKRDAGYVTKRSADWNILFPVIYDNTFTKLNEQFAVSMYPMKFIIDNKGNLVTKKDNAALSLSSFELFMKEK